MSLGRIINKMAEGYNVELSSELQIAFPAECLICRRNAHGEKRTIQIGPLDHNLAFSKIKNTIDVPMHGRCSKKFGLSFWKRYGFLLICGVVNLIIFAMYFDITKEPTGQYILKRIILMLGFVAVVAPFFIWWHNHPLQIECEYEKGNYVFTFEDRVYAEKFAQLNKTTIKKRV